MSESKRTSGPQFRADRPQEQEAVRTTIVGGRPPGSGQRLGPIPRGVEVLVRKASVDDEFRQLLLSERAEAAGRIGLTLDPAEAMMLKAVPAEQLETIIAQTSVPQEHRLAFLGTAAAAMLAAIGVISSGCDSNPSPAGIAPDEPPSVDPHGRPTRNIMAEEGGAAPDEPPGPREDPEPSPSQDGSAEEPGPAEGGSPDSGQEPTATGGTDSTSTAPDQVQISRGIRPDNLPAPTGSRPDLPDPPPQAEPPGAGPPQF